MNQRLKRSCILILLLLFGFATFAQLEDTLFRPKIGGLPTVFYTPETRLGFGGLVYSYFKIGKEYALVRKSNTQSYLTYTFNKQFAFENDYQLWLSKNRVFLTGSFNYNRCPIYFYGVGNATQEHHKKLISMDIVKINCKQLFRVKGDFYFGFSLLHQRVFNQQQIVMSPQTMRLIHGEKGYVSSGWGPTLIVDKRDNPLNPSKGAYIETSLMDFNYLIRNRHSFIGLTGDFRKYHSFSRGWVWNGNFYFSFNKGEVPYSLLPEIGGARFLRGYYKGRFRDNNMVVVQQEVRIPVYKLLGVALFGGVGNVSESLARLKENKVHYNYGLGLRIRVNKKENTNIRIDYGFTKDSQGMYVVFAEAF